MKTKMLFVIVLIVALLSACVPATPAVVVQPTVPAPSNTPAVIVPSQAPSNTVAVIVPTETPVPTGTTVPTNTPVPTIAPIPVRLIVQTVDHTIMMVDPNITLGTAPNPAFIGVDPKGGVIGSTAYVYDAYNGPMVVMAVDENGARQVDFIQNPTYGLAVWSGTEPRLAWGTQLNVPNSPSSLHISAPDGSQLETL
jgi:hypothetical protein